MNAEAERDSAPTEVGAPPLSTGDRQDEVSATTIEVVVGVTVRYQLQADGTYAVVGVETDAAGLFSDAEEGIWVEAEQMWRDPETGAEEDAKWAAWSYVESLLPEVTS